MVERLYRELKPRDWNDVAADFETLHDNAAPLARVQPSNVSGAAV